jgi:hypothetical protein
MLQLIKTETCGSSFAFFENWILDVDADSSDTEYLGCVCNKPTYEKIRS